MTEIVQNLSLWSAMQITQPQDVWAFSTYNGLISLLQSDRYPMAAFIGSRNVEFLIIFIPAIIRSVQALILCAAVAIWLRPEPVETHRVINLGLLLAMITSEAGIYTLAYFSFLVMMEPWRGPARKWMIIATYALAIPADFSIQSFPPIMRDTFLNHSSTEVVYHLTLFPFIRPMVVLSIATALSLSIIAAVWRDIRTQGWADRWRFRRDVPLLPWVRRPQPLGRTGTAVIPD